MEIRERVWAEAPERAGPVTIYLRQAPAGNPRDRSLLVDAVAAASGVAAETVRIETACARCGSAEHGKPVVRAPTRPGGGSFQVSLSRTRGLVGVAVSGVQRGSVPAGASTGSAAGIGLDLESIADVGRASIDAMLHPTELAALHALPTARQNHRRALLWTAKEAVLKAVGVGLNTDPALLELRVAPDGSVSVVDSPTPPACEGAPRITVFALPGRLVGAVASFGADAGGIRFIRLAPANGTR